MVFLSRPRSSNAFSTRPTHRHMFRFVRHKLGCPAPGGSGGKFHIYILTEIFLFSLPYPGTFSHFPAWSLWVRERRKTTGKQIPADRFVLGYSPLEILQSPWPAASRVPPRQGRLSGLDFHTGKNNLPWDCRHPIPRC